MGKPIKKFYRKINVEISVVKMPVKISLLLEFESYTVNYEFKSKIV